VQGDVGAGHVARGVQEAGLNPSRRLTLQDGEVLLFLGHFFVPLLLLKHHKPNQLGLQTNNLII
jgi:hypothetical protein